jgi:hypothetical protein
MTTIATQHHRGVPFVAAICLAGGIAGAGIVGVAWHAASDSTAPQQAPTLQTYPSQGYYWRDNQYQPFTGPPRSVENGQSELGGVDGHVPQAPALTAAPRARMGAQIGQ